MLLDDVLQELEQNIVLAREILSVGEPDVDGTVRCKVKYGKVEDASMLRCGCIVSEALVVALAGLGAAVACPVCGHVGLEIVGAVGPLRSLHEQLEFYRQSWAGERLTTAEEGGSASVGRQQSLLGLFHKAAARAASPPHEAGVAGGAAVQRAAAARGEVADSLAWTSVAEEREFYFVKCFPMYRRRQQFATHAKFLRTKSKLFVHTCISPGCERFVLLSETKWEVYDITAADKPVLMCCGKSTGEYGPCFSRLRESPAPELGHPGLPDRWKHMYCRISKELLVISGTKGYIRVFDLLQNGRPIYTHNTGFPIRCIDLDPKGHVIACGITGRDRATGSDQALIVFQRVLHKPEKIEFPPQVTIALPYRDPINTLQFSSDGLYLSCTTALESRFLVISLKSVSEPRLVMKSLRSIDTALESEGVTSAKLFPGNPNLMCVTSVAFNSPPIVVNTKIESIDGVHTVAQPTMLLRLEELGSKIYSCEVSPRNDAIAFLDRNGTVYLMFAPTIMGNETRRIVAVDIVANASRACEAASMKFNSDGHKLYILDRKGILHVQDFAYGLPHHHEVTKCKQVN
ncbi:AFR608Wp [Eremothecium gossypii ATCC 10895]|uniref:AFR608Wp n=1 Tax=Eremothecium gossypii (strain ATCC 10895 / CBS 109.51 / FGSC 9923 / NRRL Y-1056) TaxID=284811 RepID=Q752G8_EREGS|nr:AFR608Wp [Eremothecium gossypii ATCC 10895]AAS53979.2 AFR608Wp [Eremothecium gossypii ATCC 10895]AEY98293.1 FAFR608Wp [Eremothecium gossypii FDAG1]